MKRTVAASLFLVASTALGNAQIAVIDGANLDVARENAENTSSIMKSNEDILEKSQEILQALSGTRSGSLGIGQQGLGGGMSIASAPSFGSVLNGGTLSFGGLGGQAQQIAGAVINGLQLVKQLKAVIQGEDPGAVNSLYSGSVNASALLAALTQQASQGVTTREQSLQSATGQIGQAENVKGGRKHAHAAGNRALDQRADRRPERRGIGPQRRPEVPADATISGTKAAAIQRR